MKIKFFNKKSFLTLTLASSIALFTASSYDRAIGHADGSNKNDKSIEDNVDSNKLKELLERDDVTEFKECGYGVATVNVNLRPEPNTDNKRIGLIIGGKDVKIYGVTDNGWFLVEYDGKIGFASSEYFTNLVIDESVTIPEYDDGVDDSQYEYEMVGVPASIDYQNEERYGYITGNKVNFREVPTKINNNPIRQFKKGTQVRILQFINGWYYVEYNGVYGYVSANYLSYDYNDEYRGDFYKVVYITEATNLYMVDENNEPYKYTFSRGEVCEVLGENERWYLVRYSDTYGYVRKKYTDKIASTAVVVDVSSQKEVLYRDNKIVFECDVVTGKKDVWDTPEGMFKVQYKQTDRFLTSEKYGYDVHVDYWVYVVNGCGFHDSSRRTFGDDVYIRDGSHGCINMPLKYVKILYDNVKKGTSVIIHK